MCAYNPANFTSLQKKIRKAQKGGMGRDTFDFSLIESLISLLETDVPDSVYKTLFRWFTDGAGDCDSDNHLAPIVELSGPSGEWFEACELFGTYIAKKLMDAELSAARRRTLKKNLTWLIFRVEEQDLLQDLKEDGWNPLWHEEGTEKRKIMQFLADAIKAYSQKA